MKDLVIIGAGDFGREITALVERINEKKREWRLIGFLDDDPNLQGAIVEGYSVVGNTDWLCTREADIYAVCSIGNSAGRKKTVEKLHELNNLHFATLIDPDAVLMRGAKVHEGSIVCARSVLSINVQIGKHSIVNLNCTFGHDTTTGDFFTAHPGSNFSGKVNIGQSVYFGTGCKVIQGLSISGETVFGAGAVVVRNVTEKGTYVGVPVKRIG